MKKGPEKQTRINNQFPALTSCFLTILPFEMD